MTMDERTLERARTIDSLTWRRSSRQRLILPAEGLCVELGVEGTFLVGKVRSLPESPPWYGWQTLCRYVYHADHDNNERGLERLRRSVRIKSGYGEYITRDEVWRNRLNTAVELIIPHSEQYMGTGRYGGITRSRTAREDGRFQHDCITVESANWILIALGEAIRFIGGVTSGDGDELFSPITDVKTLIRNSRRRPSTNARRRIRTANTTGRVVRGTATLVVR